MTPTMTKVKANEPIWPVFSETSCQTLWLSDFRWMSTMVRRFTIIATATIASLMLISRSN